MSTGLTYCVSEAYHISDVHFPEGAPCPNHLAHLVSKVGFRVSPPTAKKNSLLQGVIDERT